MNYFLHFFQTIAGVPIKTPSSMAITGVFNVKVIHKLCELKADFYSSRAPKIDVNLEYGNYDDDRSFSFNVT